MSPTEASWSRMSASRSSMALPTGPKTVLSRITMSTRNSVAMMGRVRLKSKILPGSPAKEGSATSAFAARPVSAALPGSSTLLLDGGRKKEGRGLSQHRRKCGARTRTRATSHSPHRLDRKTTRPIEQRRPLASRPAFAPTREARSRPTSHGGKFVPHLFPPRSSYRDATARINPAPEEGGLGGGHDGGGDGASLDDLAGANLGAREEAGVDGGADGRHLRRLHGGERREAGAVLV